MTKISNFTPIKYTRPSSCPEKVLSALSNYFYLGGKQAIVVNDHSVRLETGKISWYLTALKITSYVLFFPITLILFAINLSLRYQRSFTVINSFDAASDNKLKPSSSSMQSQDIDSEHSLKLKETKAKKNDKEDILDTLIKFAPKEDDAFLIDFSKINPSNIFKIFDKHPVCKFYGDVSIDDVIRYDESASFTQNFPFKFTISVVIVEKNEHGSTNSNVLMFTMNNEGKVESYGRVFDNFDLYLDYFMKRGAGLFSFDHLDFRSLADENGCKKLRKKSAAEEINNTNNEP